MSSLCVWECPRYTYGTLGCSCASLACPYARTRLPLLGWGGLRLSLAAQGGGMTKNLKKTRKISKYHDFRVFSTVCSGCSQHASGTPACLCALRFASTSRVARGVLPRVLGHLEANFALTLFWDLIY